MGRTNWKVMVAAVVMGSGCATPMSARMQAVQMAAPIQPDSGQATIVFLRPGGGGANAIIDEGGQALGEMPKGSKLVVKVAPGQHLFVKAVLRDPGAGDYALNAPGDITCHALAGNFEANKLYFVEAGLFRLFTVKPGDGRLAEWAALPAYGLDPTRASNAAVTSDPGWSVCLDAAKRNLAGYKDQKSLIAPDDGHTRWPG